MQAATRAVAAMVIAAGAFVTGSGAAEAAYGPSPTSVELTRLIKLNNDNRPLNVALPEIRRLVTLAASPRPRPRGGDDQSSHTPGRHG